jgi:hypothetical protein
VKRQVIYDFVNEMLTRSGKRGSSRSPAKTALI